MFNRLSLTALKRKTALFLALVLVIGMVPFFAPAASEGGLGGLAPQKVFAADSLSESGIQISDVKAVGPDDIYLNIANFDAILEYVGDMNFRWDAVVSADGEEIIYAESMGQINEGEHVIDLYEDMEPGVTYVFVFGVYAVSNEDSSLVHANAVTVQWDGFDIMPQVSNVKAVDSKTVEFIFANMDEFNEGNEFWPYSWEAYVLLDGEPVGENFSTSGYGDEFTLTLEDGRLEAGVTYTLEFTVLENTVTKTFRWNSSESSGSGRSSSRRPKGDSKNSKSSSASKSSVTDSVPTVTVSTEAGKPAANILMPAAANRAGLVKLSVDSSVIENSIAQMQAAVKKLDGGEAPGALEVDLSVETSENANSISVELGKKAFLLLSSAGAGLNINSGVASCLIDGAGIAEMLPAVTDKVDLTVAPASIANNLEAKSLIGNRPVFNFVFKERGIALPSLSEGSITYSLPYTLAEGESAGNIVIVQVTGAVSGTQIIEAVYENGFITFKGDTAGVYGVGYTAG